MHMLCFNLKKNWYKVNEADYKEIIYYSYDYLHATEESTLILKGSILY